LNQKEEERAKKKGAVVFLLLLFLPPPPLYPLLALVGKSLRTLLLQRETAKTSQIKKVIGKS
jgi:hypothetical protein